MVKIPEMKSCPLRDKVSPYPSSPALADAWHQAVLFACTDTELIRAFEDETGQEFPLERTEKPSALIKEGGQKGLMQFIEWFNRTIWKEDPFNGPSEETRL